MYFNSFLYISGGGSINLYQQTASNWYNSFFGYINVNYTFEEVVIPCSPGTMASGEICVLCSPGTYSDRFSNAPCTPCNPGTYLSVAGANSNIQCLPCPEGTFNGIFGSHICRQCPYYNYCPMGSISPKSTLDILASESIQPKNYNQMQNSGLISQIQLIIIGILVAIAVIIVLIYGKKIKSVDFYIQYHEYKFNVPIFLNKTVFGAAFTLLFAVYAIFLITSAVLTYSLNNINEIKELQPLLILKEKTENFDAFIKIEISLINYLDQCDYNSGLISLNISGIIKANFNSTESFSCYKEGNYSCIILYYCNNCYITPDAFILAILAENSSFASGISVSIESTSSIPESDSYFQLRTMANSQKVFAGSIATIFYFSMVPSYFESDSRNYPSPATGYHIFQETPLIRGSQYYIEDLETISKLLVLVNLPLTLFGLYTTRFAIQRFFILISTLLGSIAGSLGAVRFLMKFTEHNYNKFGDRFKQESHINNLVINNLNLKQNLAKACLADKGSLKMTSCTELITCASSNKNIVPSKKIILKL